MGALEQLRLYLFGTVKRLDASRAYLTGLSHGGDGVWNWALHSPLHTWAGIVPVASRWPVFIEPELNQHGTSMDRTAIAKLSQIRTLVAHCHNDHASPPYRGSREHPEQCESVSYVGGEVQATLDGAYARSRSSSYWSSRERTGTHDCIITAAALQPHDPGAHSLHDSSTAAALQPRPRRSHPIPLPSLQVRLRTRVKLIRPPPTRAAEAEVLQGASREDDREYSGYTAATVAYPALVDLQPPLRTKLPSQALFLATQEEDGLLLHPFLPSDQFNQDAPCRPSLGDAGAARRQTPLAAR